MLATPFPIAPNADEETLETWATPKTEWPQLEINEAADDEDKDADFDEDDFDDDFDDDFEEEEDFEDDLPEDLDEEDLKHV